MLSVVDIQNKEFKRNKIGGYNIDEVDEYLEQIVKAYQEVLNENYILKEKVASQNKNLEQYHKMESTIQNVLILADKTAQDIKTAAYEKAEQIKSEANDRAEKITSLAEERVTRIIDQGRQEAYELSKKVEEAKSQYLTYKSQFKQLLQTQIDLLDQSDVRMMTMQDELLQVFSKIQEDTLVKPVNDEETMQSLEEARNEVASHEEEFYTKAYVPLSNEEIDGLLKNK